jgi:peptidylprolyl isomerase
MTIKKGDKVKIEYTGKLTDGAVFDASEGKEPLKFEVGAGEVIPGFDKAVEGMKKDEDKTFTLSVEEAYGPVRPELLQEFPKDKLPTEPEPKEGMMLVMQAPNGQQVPAKIAKVDGDKVIIDINHPLAGKELTFDIKVVGVNEPEAEKKDDEKEEEGCGPSGCGGCSGC